MKKKYFVDTNLFLRFLTNDIPEKAQHFEELLRRSLRGEIRLIVNTMVFAEIVWTLESYYKYERRTIDEIVSSLAASKAFEFDERDIVLQALENYQALNVDFIDAYISAWMEANGIRDIFTYNRKHFTRFKKLNVHTP